MAKNSIPTHDLPLLNGESSRGIFGCNYCDCTEDFRENFAPSLADVAQIISTAAAKRAYL
ncbi:MAG: hypothetical protein ACSHXD_14915 [Marinosulfonomonas sp.]